MTSLLPAIPEGLKVLRNAHGYNHYFTHLQMDKYGRDCAAVMQAEIDRLHQRIRSLEREDFRADAHRLALELECILLDAGDTAKVSKWWGSGMEAIEQHRQLVRDVDKSALEQP